MQFDMIFNILFNIIFCWKKFMVLLMQNIEGKENANCGLKIIKWFLREVCSVLLNLLHKNYQKCSWTEKVWKKRLHIMQRKKFWLVIKLLRKDQNGFRLASRKEKPDKYFVPVLGVQLERRGRGTWWIKCIDLPSFPSEAKLKWQKMRVNLHQPSLVRGYERQTLTATKLKGEK